MKTHTSIGPDFIPAILLKNCKSVARPMIKYLRRSLDRGKIDPVLIKSIVCPGLKPGKCKKNPVSYRPINNTCVASRIFEKVVKDKLVEHIEKIGFLPGSQHGFRRGCSCLSKLITQIDDILEAVESGYQVDVIYADMLKGFDRIDIRILCSKLKIFGICGKLLIWIENFVKKRMFAVKVSEAYS